MKIFEKVGNGKKRVLIGHPIEVTKKLEDIIMRNDVTLFFICSDFYSKFYNSLPQLMTTIGKIIPAYNLDNALKSEEYQFIVELIVQEIRNKSVTHVLLDSNMWHPKYLADLRKDGIILTTKIVDDPEGSRHYSKPIVKYYDKCICSGISYDKHRTIQEMYCKWGAKRVKFIPVFIRSNHYDDNPIDYSKKDIDIIHAGVFGWKRWISLRIISRKFEGRIVFYSHYDPRKSKNIVGIMYRILDFFLPLPQTKKVSDDELKDAYKRSKIGLNLHLSYGPSNARTYELCLNGVLQITNNEKGYKKIYSVGNDVVCFNNMKEAINLVEYYLKNDSEREKIAKSGYEKAMKEYTYENIFDKHLKYILEK